MRVWAGITASACALACGPALGAPADGPVRTAPAPAPAKGTSVESYAPSFFAALRPETALDMVNALPGFVLDTGQQVRGFVGAAGNVLIDGDRPATKNDALDEILKRIPASSVARIDVIHGGAPGIDMLGKTVVADIIQKQGGGLKLVAGVQGTVLWNGRWDYGLRLEGSQHVGKTTYEASLLLGSGADDGTGDGPHTITSARGRLLAADHEHYFGDASQQKTTASVETPALGGVVRLEGSYFNQPYWSFNDDLSPNPASREVEIYDQHQETEEVGLRFTRSFGPHLGLETYALQQLSGFSEYDNLDDAGVIQVFDLRKRLGESILRNVLTIEPGHGIQIRTGLEGDFNWMVARTVETYAGLPVPVPAADVTVTEARGEAFVDATWTAGPKFTLEGAVRLEGSRLQSRGDVVATEQFVFPKPRWVATWTPDAPDQLQVRFEREVGQLDFNYFAAQGTLGQGEHAGNPTLTPQQDWVIEATYERRFRGGADLTLALRQYWLQDVIDYAPFCAVETGPPIPPSQCDPLLQFDAPANIGSGTRQEIGAALTLPTDGLGLRHGLLIVRATARLSRVIDPSTYQPRGISMLHPLDSEAHYTQGLPELQSSWGWDVFGPWSQTSYHYSEIDTQRLGTWVDVWFEYRPRPDVSIKIEGDNLASHGLQQIRAFYIPYRDQPGSALSSIDDRSPHFGPELTLRVRKTFG